MPTAKFHDIGRLMEMDTKPMVSATFTPYERRTSAAGAAGVPLHSSSLDSNLKLTEGTNDKPTGKKSNE